MCCESCAKYERCEKNYTLSDECCAKCSDYDDCVGIYENDKNSGADNYNEDY